MKKRLQQVVRTLSEGKLQSMVMLRAMLFEAEELRNEVDSRREHVKEVLNAIMLQARASRKAQNSPSPKTKFIEQNDQAQECDLTIQGSDNLILI